MLGGRDPRFQAFAVPNPSGWATTGMTEGMPPALAAPSGLTGAVVTRRRQRGVDRNTEASRQLFYVVQRYVAGLSFDVSNEGPVKASLHG